MWSHVVLNMALPFLALGGGVLNLSGGHRKPFVCECLKVLGLNVAVSFGLWL